LQGRAQLQRSLPQLRMQAAQLHALADTATTLSVAMDTTSMLSRQKLEGALRQHGLKAQNVSLSGDSVRLQFDEVPFAQLLECLTTLQKTQQLVVADAAFGAKDKAGMVSATLQLNRQKDE
jgi:general secretion pathway protein M